MKLVSRSIRNWSRKYIEFMATGHGWDIAVQVEKRKTEVREVRVSCRE